MRKNRKKNIGSLGLCILLLCSCISYNGEENYIRAKSVNNLFVARAENYGRHTDKRYPFDKSNENMIITAGAVNGDVTKEESDALEQVATGAMVTALPSDRLLNYPNGTSIPEITATAELTATPEITAAAELTATPEIMTTPDVTILPAPTEYPEPTKPDATSIPVISSKPQVTPTIPDDVLHSTHINYVLNGGVNNKKNPYYLRKGKQSKLYGATKKGYYFAGWYTRPDFQTRVKSIKANGQKTITLYARWKKVSVKKTKIISAKLIKNKKIRVKVKVQNGVKGYEYIYSTTPSFARKSIVRSKRNPKDLSRLKRKKYYIKVRSYKIDSCGNKVYGPYSSIVYCKCS